MEEEKTTISITQNLWRLINSERITTKESPENVIWRWYNLLDERRNNGEQSRSE